MHASVRYPTQDKRRYVLAVFCGGLQMAIAAVFAAALTLSVSAQDDRVRERGLQNVVISRGEPHDPRLPVSSLDVAILVHMYHEIAQPYGLLYNLVPALKSGARVGILDAFGPTAEHGTPPELLRCELAAVGYRQISFDRLTGSDAYLTIFAPPSVASRTRPEAIVPCKAR